MDLTLSAPKFSSSGFHLSGILLWLWGGWALKIASSSGTAFPMAGSLARWCGGSIDPGTAYNGLACQTWCSLNSGLLKYCPDAGSSLSGDPGPLIRSPLSSINPTLNHRHTQMMRFIDLIALNQ